jgi:putative Mn2+ efflux pump MntP
MVKSKQYKRAKEVATTKTSTFVFGVLGLIFSYAFISRAFDTGSFWQYLGSILFLVLGVKLLIRSFKK